MSYEDLKDLPTNNLDTERDFAKFSHLSAVAKFRNKNFKAKGIRTDMVLYQAGQGIVDVVTKKIQKALLNREIKWTQSQKELHYKKIAEKLSKRIHEQDYTTKLLQVCKTWGGPCTNADELEAVIQSNPDTAEKIIKTELGYYRHTHTHKSDMIARPELFKLIRITHEERLENLFILLSDNQNVATLSTASVIDLPTDDDALQAIKVANINPQGNLEVQQQDESAGPETN